MNIQPFPMCCGAYTISNWDAILSGDASKQQVKYYEQLIAQNNIQIKAYQNGLDGKGISARNKAYYLRQMRAYEDYNVRYTAQIETYKGYGDPFANARMFLDALPDTGAYITTMSKSQYDVYEPIMTEYGFTCIEAGNPVHAKNAFYVLVKIVHPAKNPRKITLDKSVKVG